MNKTTAFLLLILALLAGANFARSEEATKSLAVGGSTTPQRTATEDPNLAAPKSENSAVFRAKGPQGGDSYINADGSCCSDSVAGQNASFVPDAQIEPSLSSGKDKKPPGNKDSAQ